MPADFLLLGCYFGLFVSWGIDSGTDFILVVALCLSFMSLLGSGT